MNYTVIITGASSGIGLALAKQFITNGWNVVAAARSVEKMKSAYQLLPQEKYLLVETDVTNKQDCKDLIEQSIHTFGKIDCLINNAGISMRALFNTVDIEVIERVMDVNFRGMLYCTHAALPYIKASKGSIVGISSIAGYRGLPGRTGYSASKFAMNGFLEALRTEELKTGVHVLTASPGFTASNIRNVALTNDGTAQGQSPRKEEKMMSADEVAQKIYIAIKKRKRTIVLTRQGKLTVFLNKFFPKLTDKLVYNHMAKEDNSPFK